MLRLSLAMILLALAGPARAGDPRLFLTWHAPHGQPRATDTLTVGLGDANKPDTLFLSLEAGESSEGFVAWVVDLRIRPMDADTLASMWDPRHPNSLPAWIRPLPIAEDDTSGCPGPFPTMGVNGTAYRRRGGTDGKDVTIRSLQAVATFDSVRVEAGKCYRLTAFVFRWPAGPESRRPVCIHWLEAHLSFAGLERSFLAGVAARLNPGTGRACFDPTPTAPAAQKNAHPPTRR